MENNAIHGARPAVGFEDEAPKAPCFVEQFTTSLSTSYTWSYAQTDGRIRKLYELGKERNWNASVDIDWSIGLSRNEDPTDYSTVPFPYRDWDAYQAMSPTRQRELRFHCHAWTQSQFLHGEQGALLVASQLVSCAPSCEAKLYAASQAFDEARHVEVFSRYLRDHVGLMYPVDPSLKELLDRVLTDPRWDLKFIGMQLVIESLALSSMASQRLICRDPLLHKLVDYVLQDEARHVAFGVSYMRELVQQLASEEVRDRAYFAYEACVLMRDRFFNAEVFAAFGLDPEIARTHLMESFAMNNFRNLLFTRVVPNLRRIGLLIDELRPAYEALGVLQFENLPYDGT